WRISGDVNLTGDLVVEGTLTGGDTFTVEGNGHQILFQHGGRADLAGMPKTAWCRWGDGPVGWQIGDRLSVAPTKAERYAPYATIWQGSWEATIRSANTADVPLPDGTVARPEVVNLSQTAVINGVSRVMFHHGAGVQQLAYLNVRGAGVTGELGFYPIHFHLNGETVRGSTLAGVVVEDSAHRAFVPHASHGVTFDGCAAVGIVEEAYWWDLPPGPGLGRHERVDNNSNDTTYDHCLALGVTSSSPRMGAFSLGAGSGNRCVNSTAAGIKGGVQCGGFAWEERANDNDGGNVWEFTNNVVHNSWYHGFASWQNDGPQHPDRVHTITDSVAFSCRSAGIDHGAYTNNYHWKRIVLGANGFGVASHALPRIDVLFEDIVSADRFRIRPHAVRRELPVVVRRMTAPGVWFNEGTGKASYYRFEDCGWCPDDFDVSNIHLETVFEIWEGGVLTHRWADGAWT
ncbi:MAG: hypothetical protein WEF28_09230, partial [Acidimicrobiia bacterium]